MITRPNPVTAANPPKRVSVLVTIDSSRSGNSPDQQVPGWAAILGIRVVTRKALGLSIIPSPCAADVAWRAARPEIAGPALDVRASQAVFFEADPAPGQSPVMHTHC